MQAVLSACRKKGWVIMRKKWNEAGRIAASAVAFVFVSLTLFLQSGMQVCAAQTAPPERIEKTFRLTSDEILQVPRYMIEGNAGYGLDEASIVVEEIERGSAEGADVVTFSRKTEDLSDNDLARIEKNAVMEGIDCELLSVAYKVEEEDKNGVPIRYSAVCEYGGLKKYGISYPTAWRLTAGYDFCESLTEPEIVEIQEERLVQKKMEQDSARTKRVTGRTENEKKEEEEKEENPGEREIRPKPEIKRFQIKPDAQEESKWIADMLVPLAAGAAGTGAVIPFIIWFSVLTAPLSGMKENGKYRYIGRVSLKKERNGYAARLTKRHLSRAELPVFRIKLQKRVWKRAKSGVFSVYCPGDKKIVTIAGAIVHFTVEGD